jgi:hypothetical protein
MTRPIRHGLQVDREALSEFELVVAVGTVLVRGTLPK